MLSSLNKIAAVTISVLSLVMFTMACSAPNGAFFYGAFDAGTPRIFVANGTAGSSTITAYDLSGNILDIIADFTIDALSPRGIAPIDMFNFAVALDGTDQIGNVNLLGDSSTLVSNASLTGNLYQLRRTSTGDIYVIETNTIEAFSADGTRLQNPRVGTTITSCTLSTPRGMDIDSSGRLVVVGTANDDITIYDISSTNVTCFAANTTLAAGVDPFAVVAHSNGYLYVATQGDDRIYQFNGDGSGTGTIIFDNISVISNPSAILEMPDGTLLVASDGTNSIEQITTAGVRVGSGSLIVDGFTGSVTDMAIMPEQ